MYIGAIVAIGIIFLLLVIFVAWSASCSKTYYERKPSDNYDFCIIGGGTTGSVLAYLLGMRGYSVLVVEAGGNENNNPNVLELDLTKLPGSDPATRIYYPTNASDATVARAEAILGKAWGGSMAINFAFSMRPSEEYLQYMQSLHPEWSVDKQKEYYKELETYVPLPSQEPASDLRGSNGPITISSLDNADSAGTFIQNFAALVNSTFMPNADYNLYQRVVFPLHPQFNYTDLNNPEQAKRSFPGNTYLPSALNTGCVDIVRGDVIRLDLNEKTRTAKSVEVAFPNECKSYSACKFLLTAGLMSAPILERSGYGDPEVLRQARVPCKYANPYVGVGLRTHYGYTTVLRVPESYAQSTPFHWYAEVYSDTEEDFPLRQMQPLFYVAIPNGDGTANMIGLTSVLNPTSSGTIHITGPNLVDQPDIQFGIAETENDQTVIQNGANLLQQAASETDDVTLLSPNPETVIEDVKDAPRLTYHFVGTCRDGYVTDRFTVHGFDNLYVCDISVLERPPDGNTGIPAVMMGYLARDELIGE